MQEIKIEEQRFLSLIDSEDKAVFLMHQFIAYLINEWKKTNAYKTIEDRKKIFDYINPILLSLNIKDELWFNNNYCNNIMFDSPKGRYGINITEINYSNGESI